MSYLDSILELDEEILLEAKHYFLAPFIGIFDKENYVGSRYVITNKRIIIKRGIIFKDYESIAISKVERVVPHQRWYKFIFDIGSIEVFGMGGGYFNFPKLSDPLNFFRVFESVNHGL